MRKCFRERLKGQLTFKLLSKQLGNLQVYESSLFNGSWGSLTKMLLPVQMPARSRGAVPARAVLSPALVDLLCCWLLWAIARTQKEGKHFQNASQQEFLPNIEQVHSFFSIAIILQKRWKRLLFLNYKSLDAKKNKPLKGTIWCPFCPLLNGDLFLHGLDRITFSLFALWQRIRVCAKTSRISVWLLSWEIRWFWWGRLWVTQ